VEKRGGYRSGHSARPDRRDCVRKWGNGDTVKLYTADSSSKATTPTTTSKVEGAGKGTSNDTAAYKRGVGQQKTKPAKKERKKEQ
jgi:hypothetical protein